MTNQEYIKKCDIFMKVHNACKEKCQCNKIDIQEEKEHVRVFFDSLLSVGRIRESVTFEEFYQIHVKAFDITGRKRFMDPDVRITIDNHMYSFQ